MITRLKSSSAILRLASPLLSAKSLAVLLAAQKLPQKFPAPFASGDD